MNRVFLLSPANCNGVRAGWILRRGARLELAHRLRSPEGAPLGEVFSFLSALYFRGKLGYARAFARPRPGTPGVLIITPNAGLVADTTPVSLAMVRGFRRVPISVADRRYRRSLEASARRVVMEMGFDCQVILLGSIATRKYLEILSGVFGERLCVPRELIGMGDMSRGALLLRCVAERRELSYVAAAALTPQRSVRALDGGPRGPAGAAKRSSSAASRAS